MYRSALVQNKHLAQLAQVNIGKHYVHKPCLQKEMLGDQIAIASPSSLHVSFSAYCQFVKVIFIAGEEEGKVPRSEKRSSVRPSFI